MYPHFCDLPGSVRSTNAGMVTVPGGSGAENLTFLHLPVGYCAHFFGNLATLTQTGTGGGNVRQLRFAPNGDLFVASPTSGTTGGGGGGLAAILVMPDDNGDGLADTAIRYATGLPSTQGLLFSNAGDYFYYQDVTRILRVPYHPGDRKLSAVPEQILQTNVYYTSGLHWPKPLDQADDGTIFVGNGSDQDESPPPPPQVCDSSRPFKGGILKADGTPNGKIVSKGFRNPIAVRCQRGHNLCFAAELAKDYSAAEGGREKLVPIRDGDDWGFPCCATKDVSYQGIMPAPDCSRITPEDVSFLIGDTPFSFDFERGKWGMPYTRSVFVPLHGAAGSWEGARIVAVLTDPATGQLKKGTNVDGGSSGAMSDFAIGWDDKNPATARTHGRPAAVEFATDGRMFVGNDNNGDIFWIAPFELPRVAAGDP
jgi:glucose/arabinose dehydrogenase